MKGNLIIFVLSLCMSASAQYDTLEIVSWNVFLRPAILNDGQMERVDSISAYVEKSGADILVLQEVFHRKARKRMINNLSKSYPNYTSVGPQSFWGIPSGVVIFSKQRIQEEKRISFLEGTGSDKMAKKGAVAATFQIWKQKIHIIGTHMQAGSGKKREEIRKRQIVRIKKLTDELDTNAIFIFAGDFNIRKDSKMFESIQDSLICNTILPEGEIQSTCSFSEPELNETESRPKWIDFILLRERNSKVKQEKVWIDEPKARIRGKKVRISDHNPIFSRILLKRKMEE